MAVAKATAGGMGWRLIMATPLVLTIGRGIAGSGSNRLCIVCFAGFRAPPGQSLPAAVGDRAGVGDRVRGGEIGLDVEERCAVQAIEPDHFEASAFDLAKLDD